MSVDPASLDRYTLVQRTHSMNDYRPLRIALYSHDTCGLGHMRRNLLIAETLAQEFESVNVLLITGAREAASFHFPTGVDAVTLPSFYKEQNQTYRSRSFHLDINEFVRLRSRIIRTSIESFSPDLFIVDKVPRGTMGELDDALSYLTEYPETRCVLGLRDILDNPDVVSAEWRAAGNTEAIERYYDSIWVYGDKTVFDARCVYGFPEKVTRKMHFTGFLDPSTRLKHARLSNEDKALLHKLGPRFFLCTVGGGQDGVELAENFASAAFPEGVNGLIITGPHMAEESTQHLQMLVNARPHLTCVNFLPEPLHLYQAAERVVAMGGYNTSFELVALGAQALIVPRVYPREEQWIRGRRLEALGLIDLMHPDQLSSEALSNWFGQPLQKPLHSQSIDMNGLERIPEIIRRLVISEVETVE